MDEDIVAEITKIIADWLVERFRESVVLEQDVTALAEAIFVRLYEIGVNEESWPTKYSDIRGA